MEKSMRPFFVSFGHELQNIFLTSSYLQSTITFHAPYFRNFLQLFALLLLWGIHNCVIFYIWDDNGFYGYSWLFLMNRNFSNKLWIHVRYLRFPLIQSFYSCYVSSDFHEHVFARLFGMVPIWHVATSLWGFPPIV